jgi:homoserine O-succinyltransferase
VSSSEWRQQHLSCHYSDFDEFWDTRFDGVIVTGTEPRADDLTAEPYWADLARIVDWVEANATASVWSCLAAHAAVQRLDGIRRSPLDKKCFGLFEHARMSDHWLLRGQPTKILAPHSRWNGVCKDALAAAGYRVLSTSGAGVDIFIKERRSLFVFFQGHPEYDADTLAREYRRDVGRYLRGERAIYPELPSHYFDSATTEVLNAFRVRAVAERGEDLMAAFPSEHVLTAVPHTWHSHAVRTYTNWVDHIVACKALAARQLRRRVSAG